MAFDLSSIKLARRDRPLRILLLGTPKVGKSTVAAQIPGVAFLPIKGEEGIDALDVQTFPIAETFSDVLEAVGALCNKNDYKTLVIDSVSKLEGLIWKECCRINGGVDSIEKVGGGFAKGYIECFKQWNELLEGLDYIRNSMGIGCVLVGHIKVENFHDPSMEPYDRYNIDLQKKAGENLIRWVDGILFMKKKVAVKKDDVGFGEKTARGIDTGNNLSYLYTQERPAHPGGGRGIWGQLPYEVAGNWPAFQEALNKAQTTK